MSGLNPLALVEGVINGEKPYLLIALRQNIAQAHGDPQPPAETKVLDQLREIAAKLTQLNSEGGLTDEERFIVQSLQIQNSLSQMNQDGEECFGLDMHTVSALSSTELSDIKQETEQNQEGKKVIDIRSRLPQSEQTQEDIEVYSAREFQLRMFDFLFLYHQLQEEHRLLLQYEREREHLMRQLRSLGVSDAQVHSMYSAPSAPALERSSLGVMAKYDTRQRELLRLLRQIQEKREALVARSRLKMDDIDRFYRDNLTLEQKLKLKARLLQPSLGPVLAPQLRLQNVLQLAPQPRPTPGMRPQPGRGRGKRLEDDWPRPRPKTPNPF